MFPIIYSDDFLLHETGSFHPENPGRLGAIQKALVTAPWAEKLDWRSPTPIAERSPLPWIEQVHSAAYLKSLQKLAGRSGAIDGDTPLSPASYDVALLAVNGWLDGVDYALQAQAPIFVLARPPGHHAEPARGMGFCVLSNGAIAATYALAQGIERVAILDWDVHHGNGTQAVVENHPQMAYCSLHQSPHYPGTGAATETGNYQNVLNLPMKSGSSMKEYQPLFETKVLPFLQDFNPDLLIVSAGYDATADDPLAGIALQPEDFGVFTRYCLQVTPKIVFGLEGGYDYDSLGRSVVETIGACLN
jgi:acetoin utilization deacetylase AcuC-like enzyme